VSIYINTKLCQLHISDVKQSLAVLLSGTCTVSTSCSRLLRTRTADTWRSLNVGVPTMLTNSTRTFVLSRSTARHDADTKHWQQIHTVWLKYNELKRNAATSPPVCSWERSFPHLKCPKDATTCKSTLQETSEQLMSRFTDPCILWSNKGYFYVLHCVTKNAPTLVICIFKGRG